MAEKHKKAAPRKRGRPNLPAGEGKRYPLNMRTTKQIRDQLEAASQESGRSLAQEVEHRLGQSFEAEKRAEEIADTARQSCYDAFGGEGHYHLFRIISEAVTDAHQRVGGDWTKDLLTFEIAKEAVLAVIENILRPDAPTLSGTDALRLAVAGKPTPSEIGKHVAERRLKAALGAGWTKVSAKILE